MSKNPVTMIYDLVRDGRATPRQGALLLELRRLLQWKRKPWWNKAVVLMARIVFEW